MLGRTLRELDLLNKFGVGLTQVRRAGVDLPVGGATALHFGDNVLAIGPDAGLDQVEAALGNSPDALNQTQLIPIFLGIALGVVAGSIPVAVPGLHTSLKIGLAGGPMLVAILLSRLGNIGSVVWYMPPAANQILRDFGIAVFLACVGFQSGDHFLQNLVHGGGLPLVGWGVLISLVPMLAVGTFARFVLRMDFVTLSGLTSGAMTNSPTLLFANELTGSNAPGRGVRRGLPAVDAAAGVRGPGAGDGAAALTDHDRGIMGRMDPLLARITIDPSICHGKPCIRGLRYPVEWLLDLLTAGMTTDEILADYEDLERDDVRAALAYAARLARTRRLEPVRT